MIYFKVKRDISSADITILVSSPFNRYTLSDKLFALRTMMIPVEANSLYFLIQ